MLFSIVPYTSHRSCFADTLFTTSPRVHIHFVLMLTSVLFLAWNAHNLQFQMSRVKGIRTRKKQGIRKLRRNTMMRNEWWSKSRMAEVSHRSCQYHHHVTVCDARHVTLRQMTGYATRQGICFIALARCWCQSSAGLCAGACKGLAPWALLLVVFNCTSHNHKSHLADTPFTTMTYVFFPFHVPLS